MNKERIEALIEHLEAIDEKRFAMEWWAIPVEERDNPNALRHVLSYTEDLDATNWCGTAGCLAGHTCMLFPGEGRIDGGHNSIKGVAQRILGLKFWEASYLFTPMSAGPLEDVTLERAIAVLRRFHATGSIDWSLGIMADG